MSEQYPTNDESATSDQSHSRKYSRGRIAAGIALIMVGANSCTASCNSHGAKVHGNAEGAARDMVATAPPQTVVESFQPQEAHRTLPVLDYGPTAVELPR